MQGAKQRIGICCENELDNILDIIKLKQLIKYNGQLYAKYGDKYRRESSLYEFVWSYCFQPWNARAILRKLIKVLPDMKPVKKSKVLKRYTLYYNENCKHSMELLKKLKDNKDAIIDCVHISKISFGIGIGLTVFPTIIEYRNHNHNASNHNNVDKYQYENVLNKWEGKDAFNLIGNIDDENTDKQMCQSTLLRYLYHVDYDKIVERDNLCSRYFDNNDGYGSNCNRGPFKNKKRTGTWIQLCSGDNPNFQRILKYGKYVDGHKHGEWVCYFSNNVIKYILTYKHGQRHGDAVEYWINGNLKSRGTYKNTSRCGKWETFRCDGVLSSSKIY